MISWPQIAGSWNHFFFRPESPLPIAVYRILLGLLLLANQLLLLPEVMVWFGDKGTLTAELATKIDGGRGLSFFLFLPPTDWAVWMVYWLSCAFAFALTLGLFTRVSAAAMFLCLLSLQQRNPIVLNSGDTFLRLATFFIIFSQAGAALSVDRFLRIKRHREQPGPPPPREPWAQRLIQLQLSFLYLYAVTWKLMGTMWVDGSAVYYTSRLQEFWRLPLPYVFEHMWTIRLWSWSTLVLELSLALLIWVKELRYWVIIGGVLLHIGIEWTMNIPLFGFIMMSAYVLFVDPGDLERFLAKVKGKLSWAQTPKLESPPEPLAQAGNTK